MRPLAEQANVGLRLDMNRCRGGGDSILADPRRLKQVLLNLIANAIKYNRPRWRRSSVRCSRTRRATLQIAVTDTGPGIAAADLERIFARRSPAWPATQEVPGTGSGTVACRKRADRSDGRARWLSASDARESGARSPWNSA